MLGAPWRSIVAMVVRNGMDYTTAGLVLGLLGAVALARALQGLVYDVITDPLTLCSGDGGGAGRFAARELDPRLARFARGSDASDSPRVVGEEKARQSPGLRDWGGWSRTSALRVLLLVESLPNPAHLGVELPVGSTPNDYLQVLFS